MTRRVIIAPRADRDPDDTADYLERQRRGVGARFYRAARQHFARLLKTPGLGQRWESEEEQLGELRYSLVPRFKNYVIYYRPIPDGIEVLRVLHGARDLGSLLEAEET